MPTIATSSLSFYAGLRLGVAGTSQPPQQNFENGNFTNDLTGWEVYAGAVSPGGLTQYRGDILGCPIPADPTPYPMGVSMGDIPTPSPGQTTEFVAGLSGFNTEIVADGPNGNYLKMTMFSYSTTPGGATIYGPVIYSKNPVSLAFNDKISFNWTAFPGEDAYNVFAYIIDPTNCRSFILLDATGNSSSASAPWQTISKIMRAGEGGNYHFVFMAGSFDYNFGGATGATLGIDGVKVEKAGTY